MSTHRGIARRRSGLVVTAVLGCAAVMSGLAVVGVAGAGSAAAGSSTNSFRLSVVATSVETLVQSQSLPVIGISGSLQAATFGASAGLSSVGESSAEAGVPFSPFVSSLPGTAGGLVGAGLPKIPTLPGFVSSSFPARPSASSSQAGFGVEATSTATMSEGKAGLGATSPGTARQTAFAQGKTVANDDGSVSAVGVTGIDLLNFGDLFDIGNVSTAAAIHISQEGKIAYQGDSQLGTITLNKLPTGVGAKGVGLLGAGVPIPIKDNLETLNSLLAPVGVTLRVLDAVFVYADGSTSSGDRPDPFKSLKSVTTAGLSVAIAQDVPTQGIVTVTEILGRAIVSATSRPDAALAAAPSGTDSSSPETNVLTGGATGASGGPSSGGVDSAASMPVLLPSLSTSGEDRSAGNGTPLVPTAALVPGAGTGQGQAELVAVRAAGTSNSGEGPYLLLALAGLLAVLSSLVIRITAVRLTFFKP